MKKPVSLLLAIALSFAGWAQLDTTAFKSFIRKAQVEMGVPAVSVAVVKSGEVLLSANYGTRSKDSGKAPDGNTQFGIASLTKAFTACAMAMLVEEGKVAWLDPVVKHLPDFRLHDSIITNKITIEDILSHRSGLETFDGDLLWYGTTYSREEVIERIRHQPLSYGLREKFGYQNIMYMTAGEIIEKVSGMTWDEFVRQRILVPLKMNRTVTDFESFMADFNRATPHIDGKEIFMLSYNNSGATAAISSTTNDLCKWMAFWLNKGTTPDGKQLLSPQSVERLWSSYISLDLGKFDKENGTNFKAYGMGWFLMDYHGKKVVHHSGGLPGYISKIALVPETGLGIAVLTNDMSSLSTMLMYAAADWADGRDYKHWLETFKGFETKGKQKQQEEKDARLKTKITKPQRLPVEDYIGTYRDVCYGDARVTMGDDGLVLSLLPTKELFTGKLQPWGNHAFRFDHNDPFLTYGIITFEVKEGTAHGFTIELPNQDFHFQKLRFERVE